MAFYFRAFVFELLMMTVYGQENVLQYSVSENVQKGTYLGNVDKDSNLRSTVSSEDYSHIKYSFLHEGHSYQNLFSVNAVNGSVYTYATIDRESIQECEYETSCVLPLSVVAQSKISAFFRKIKLNITIVDVNDHAPSFSKERTVLEISEIATVGSAIALVGAVDADSGNNSLQIYYILESDTHDLPFATSFEKFVDGTSVVKLEITGNLDRETKDFYNLTIVAEDNGDPKLTGTMEVNILIEDSNDNAPVFTQSPYNVTIAENTEVGTEILRLTATDADLGVNSEIMYSLSRNQMGKIHDLFVVNETTGALCVKSAFTNAAQYRVIVEATDKGLQPLMEQAVVVIQILDSNNNPPEITINLFSDTGIAKISEFANVGTVVAHVGLVDKDTGINGVIECEISSDHGVFKLQGFDFNEFKVTVAKELDRETMEFVYVIINCYDKGSPPLSSYVEFSVQITDENDESPRFLQEIYFVDVYENNKIDLELVQVSAIDNDIGDNGDIRYSAWATGKYQFYIDAVSGFIKTMSSFDRETDDRVTLYAYAKDKGSPQRTGTATVILNILDVNDNDPRFDAEMFVFNVSENLAAGTSVGTIVVQDDDTDKNGQLSLIIDADLPFTIDSSGLIKTDRQLDREDKHIYSFLVTAFDHGVPSRNSTSSVVVHILDVNDNHPVFVFPEVANYTVVIPIDTQPKSVVAKIKAFDLDERMDSQKQLFYSILNTNVSKTFTMDGNTGEITLARPLLDTDQEIFNIQLRVEDNGNPKRHNTTSLQIFIERLETPKRPSDTGGENMLIAIVIGCVTFVLVFTIVLVIFILRMKARKHKDEGESDQDRFYDKPHGEKRVQFAEIAHHAADDMDFVSKATKESRTPVSDDVMEKEADLDLMSTDEPVPKEEKKTATRKSPPLQLPKIENKSSSGSLESRRSTSGSDTRHSTPRSDSQLNTLQNHSSLIQSHIKPLALFPTFGHEDNHSQTSAETTTSDSGRGGSESDLHSTSLTHSHDSEMRPFNNRPLNSTSNGLTKPWMNLADLQFNHPRHSSVIQQLQDDRRHRLQFKSHSDKNNANNIKRNMYTQSHSSFDRSKFVTFQEPQIFPPPPSDLDRSFITYEEEDDDGSTTTSGSYTIDHEDVTLDMHSPGLRGCLV